MIIINGDGGCRLWQPVQADSQSKSSGLVLGRRPLGTVLHSSNEPGELSQWLCHDDSTINIVLELLLLLLTTDGRVYRTVRDVRRCRLAAEVAKASCSCRPEVTS